MGGSGGSGGLRCPPVMSTLPGEMGWMEPEPRRGGEAERGGAGGEDGDGWNGDEGGLSVGGATWAGTFTCHSFIRSTQKARLNCGGKTDAVVYAVGHTWVVRGAFETDETRLCTSTLCECGGDRPVTFETDATS